MKDFRQFFNDRFSYIELGKWALPMERYEDVLARFMETAADYLTEAAKSKRDEK